MSSSGVMLMSDINWVTIGSVGLELGRLLGAAFSVSHSGNQATQCVPTPHKCFYLLHHPQVEHQRGTQG